MKSALMAATLSIILAACGGGGSEAPTPTAQAATCRPKVVTVQLFGDSTMFGYDSFTRAKAVPSPAQDLQSAMDVRFGLGAVVVRENGVLGATISDLIKGRAGYQAWPLGVAADVVVVNYGINDQDLIIGESIEEYESNLRAIAAYKGAAVVFETPNATPGPNVRFDAYVQRMRDVAVSLSVPVADTFLAVKAVPDWETYFADFAHPNAAMYGLIVKNSLAPAVAKQVAPLRCE